MAKRILPYRDYSEHDVVNLFALDVTGKTLSSFKSNGTGDFDAGVVVSVSAGALPGEVSELRATTPDNLRDYLGASFSGAHIGFNGYPANTGMTVAPADGTGRALGITLRETLAFDENGEKMISYKQKLDEAQGVLPGQSVPILTKGLILLSASAFSSAPALGDDLEVSSTAGKLKTAASGTVVGSVLAIGEESDDSSSKKYLCKISF
tara:strand:- start:4756 stop:5379 length:624 start_codon:yes stop_codon:yes gene_type:complete